MINNSKLAVILAAVFVAVGLFWWIPAGKFLGAAFMDRAVLLAPHQWLNLGFAVLGAMVALGAINQMSRETERPIMFAFVTVGTGLLGAAATYFAPDRWEIAFDTLMYGGMVGLLIGTRRRTVWIHPRWMPLVSVLATTITWITFFATVRG